MEAAVTTGVLVFVTMVAVTGTQDNACSARVATIPPTVQQSAPYTAGRTMTGMHTVIERRDIVHNIVKMVGGETGVIEPAVKDVWTTPASPGMGIVTRAATRVGLVTIVAQGVQAAAIKTHASEIKEVDVPKGVALASTAITVISPVIVAAGSRTVFTTTTSSLQSVDRAVWTDGCLLTVEGSALATVKYVCKSPETVLDVRKAIGELTAPVSVVPRVLTGHVIWMENALHVNLVTLATLVNAVVGLIVLGAK